MAYFNTCPYCDAALDPGEKCDCKRSRAERREHEAVNRKTAKRERNRMMRREALHPINKGTA